MSAKDTPIASKKITAAHAEAVAALAGLGAPRSSPGRPAEPSSMAGRIEHTLLASSATEEDVRRVCREAERHELRAVCCLPRDVAACRRRLDGTAVLVVTVLDFPLAGGGAAEDECRRAVEAGADEVDMVVDLRALRSGRLVVAARGVRRVVKAARGRPVKVILETGLLTPEQIAAGAAVVEIGGAAFAKTSTGYGPRGANVEDIRILRAVLGDRLGIKASGGIRDSKAAEAMVAAGADLIGTSNGPACAG
ncbi:MAG: deoxyribose-phosphate aldolase [Proteobacteria bacterium]|jgi:deoxyribose-phosphate aldolase|nr:deoxyribose-phosphate aldolase [Pseudomonadota bacterium]